MDRFLSIQYLKKKKSPELCLPLLTPTLIDQILGPILIPGVGDVSLTQIVWITRWFPWENLNAFAKERMDTGKAETIVVHCRVHYLIPWIFSKGGPTVVPARHHISPSKNLLALRCRIGPTRMNSIQQMMPDKGKMFVRRRPKLIWSLGKGSSF